MKRQCRNCKHSGVQSKFKPVTHVIFDLDGVIIDSNDVYRQAFRKTVEDYGCLYSDDVYTIVAGGTSPLVAKIAIEHYNLDVPLEHFVKKYRGYSREGLNDLTLIPGVEKLIRHLHSNGVPIAIATSSAREYVDFKMKNFLGLLSLFDPIICGDDPAIKHGKPEPDMYLVCASRFAAKPSPSKCLVFEDSTNGMRAGVAAGMQVVMIPDEDVPPEIWQLATVKIDSFDSMVPEWFGLPPYSSTNT